MLVLRRIRLLLILRLCVLGLPILRLRLRLLRIVLLILWLRVIELLRSLRRRAIPAVRDRLLRPEMSRAGGDCSNRQGRYDFEFPRHCRK